MENVEELKNRLDQAKIDKQSIEKNIEELQKEIESKAIPQPKHSFELTVGLNKNFESGTDYPVVVKCPGGNTEMTDGTKGTLITVQEARHLAEILNEFADYAEKNKPNC